MREGGVVGKRSAKAPDSGDELAPSRAVSGKTPRHAAHAAPDAADSESTAGRLSSESKPDAASGVKSERAAGSEGRSDADPESAAGKLGSEGSLDAAGGRDSESAAGSGGGPDVADPEDSAGSESGSDAPDAAGPEGASASGATSDSDSARRPRGVVIALVVAAVALLAIAAIAFHVVTSAAPPDAEPESGESLAATDQEADEPDDSWMLVLVNDTHPMEQTIIELKELGDGQTVDLRCYPDLQRMFDAARAEGVNPKINSSFRSREEQQQLLDEAVASATRAGLSDEAALAEALRTVAEPGTSEHETGLAIDITSEEDSWATDHAAHVWMGEHGWEYGWIVRYPEGKEAITGIANEPWHLRYVGLEAAREMHETGQCLEEYVGAA